MISKIFHNLINIFYSAPLEETFIKLGIDDRDTTPQRHSQLDRQQSSASSTGSMYAMHTPSPDRTSHYFPGDLLQAGHPLGIPHSATVPANISQLPTDGASGYGTGGPAYQRNLSSSPMHYSGSEPSLNTQVPYGQRPTSGQTHQRLLPWPSMKVTVLLV